MPRKKKAEAAPVECAAAEETALRTAYVRDGYRLNLRKGPGREFEVLCDLDAGTQLTVGESDGVWAQVRFGNVEGYVVAEFLRD